MKTEDIISVIIMLLLIIIIFGSMFFALTSHVDRLSIRYSCDQYYNSSTSERYNK
jgi:hypothetical protein